MVTTQCGGLLKGGLCVKRYKLIACKVLYREISLLTSHCENFIDVTYLQQGLHDTPEVLRQTLQDEIDRIDADTDIYSCSRAEGLDFDAILLGYGLCSNAVCGLSSQKYKLVIPRAHDCITLFLGSKERYRQYFDAHSGGVYWYTPGWNECSLMPGKEYMDFMHRRYVEKYGEKKAALLMAHETWLEGYNTCAYVDWETLHLENHVQYAKACADYLNVRFDLVKGDPALMRHFINGNWNPEDFFVLAPGQKVAASFDETIFEAEESTAATQGNADDAH